MIMCSETLAGKDIMIMVIKYNMDDAWFYIATNKLSKKQQEEVFVSISWAYHDRDRLIEHYVRYCSVIKEDLYDAIRRLIGTGSVDTILALMAHPVLDLEYRIYLYRHMIEIWADSVLVRLATRYPSLARSVLYYAIDNWAYAEVLRVIQSIPATYVRAIGFATNLSTMEQWGDEHAHAHRMKYRRREPTLPPHTLYILCVNAFTPHAMETSDMRFCEICGEPIFRFRSYINI